jgi:death-on-curing protein
VTDGIWVAPQVVLALHEEQLAEHGGPVGIRDRALLASALDRARNKASDEDDADVAALAATYAFGIARDHPFVDGNKRTAFVVAELFLDLNGFTLEADDAECVVQVLDLATGKLSEAAFGDWLRSRLRRQ